MFFFFQLVFHDSAFQSVADPSSSCISIVKSILEADTTISASFHHVDQAGSDGDEESAVDNLIALSNNIMAVSLSNMENIDHLFSYANTSELFQAGRAWYFLQGPLASFPTSLPQGTIILNAVDATPENITDFTTILSSLSPITFPGTGPGMTLYPSTLNTYDSVLIYAQAIQNATNNFTTAITRASLNTSIADIDYHGWGGEIHFNPEGFRNYQFVELYSVLSNATSQFIGLVHGPEVLMLNDNPVVYPDNSTELPDDQIDYILVPLIWSISSISIPVPARPWIYNAASFITDLVNNNASNLPPKTRLSVSVHDDHGSAPIAVQVAMTYAPRKAAVIYGSWTVPLTQAISSIALGSNIPLTTPALTSSVFSSQTLYPTFWRLASESNFEGVAVMRLAASFGWTDVTLLSTSDSYGQGISSITIETAQTTKISIINHIIVDEDAPDFDDAVQELIDTNARVVILELTFNSYIPFSLSVLKMGWKPVAIIILDVMPTNANIGVLAVGAGLPANIWDGWLSITTAGGIGPLFDQYLAEAALSPLEGISTLAALYSLDYDTLTVIARSVKALKEQGEDPRNGTALYRQIKSFQGLLTSGFVSFEADGDREPAFDIHTIKDGIQSTVSRYTPSGGFVKIPGQKFYWPDGSTTIPISTLPKRLQWLSWTSGAGITLAIIAVIGMLIGVILLCVFWWYRDSKIIKSATWQFLIIMIIGCILGAGTTMVWLGRPHPWICALRIWLPPNAFLLILGPLMAKTWRLHRIFSISHLKVKPITLATLIWIVVVLQSVQLVICIFWIALGTIKTRTVDDPTDPTAAFALCDTNMAFRICTYITYGYIGLIILFGCYLSFKVRKLPKDFNESRWIGRTLYNISLFALLILILGYALAKYYDVILILICVGTLGISVGSMLLMMAPKIFTLWQKPESRLPTTHRDSKSGSQTGNSQDLHRVDNSSNGSHVAKRHEYTVQTMHVTHTGTHERKFSKDATSSTASSGRRSSTTTSSSGSYKDQKRRKQ